MKLDGELPDWTIGFAFVQVVLRCDCDGNGRWRCCWWWRIYLRVRLCIRSGSGSGSGSGWSRRKRRNRRVHRGRALINGNLMLELLLHSRRRGGDLNRSRRSSSHSPNTSTRTPKGRRRQTRLRNLRSNTLKPDQHSNKTRMAKNQPFPSLPSPA